MERLVYADNLSSDKVLTHLNLQKNIWQTKQTRSFLSILINILNRFFWPSKLKSMANTKNIRIKLKSFLSKIQTLKKAESVIDYRENRYYSFL